MSTRICCDIFQDKTLPLTAICTIDELNSYIGLCRSVLNSDTKIPKEDLEILEETLNRVQKKLHLIASNLSKSKDIGKIKTSDIEELENTIDKLDERLDPLANFILPTGSIESSHLHIARTIARRAERYIVEEKEVDEEILKYINRLSDLLFTMARFTNKIQGIDDIIWKNE